MWDTATDLPGQRRHLSHDLPCLRCGHAAHSYLSCSESCPCAPAPMPGTVPLVVPAA